jgi:hypothetical protein
MILAGGPSAPAARVVRITGAAARAVALGSDLGVVLRHAPVIYGRTRRASGPASRTP